MSVPNFDAMPVDELRRFHAMGGIRPVALARRLFGPRRPGMVRAAKLLRSYADNKAVAIEQRLKGNVDTALVYENICDRIYERLPEWARW